MLHLIMAMHVYYRVPHTTHQTPRSKPNPTRPNQKQSPSLIVVTTLLTNPNRAKLNSQLMGIFDNLTHKAEICLTETIVLVTA